MEHLTAMREARYRSAPGLIEECRRRISGERKQALERRGTGNRPPASPGAPAVAE